MTMAGAAQEHPGAAAARLLEIIEARFGEGLKAVREPRARGPREDPSLRLAYLELLKLALCDLVGTRTTSVARTLDGQVMSRELADEQLRFRTAGMDWPLHGLTMVGLARLDDLQACIQTVVAERVPGDVVEAGSWRGGASILARATLDTLGATDRTVFVCDSFRGFPQVDPPPEGYDLAADLAGVDFLSVPVEEVRASFARLGLAEGVSFVPGFFEETLPGLAGHRWAVVRLDGDTYEATQLSLRALYPGLATGGYLVIDDYFQIDPCREAVDDFRREHGITEPIEAIDWSGARWRRERGTLPGQAGPASAPSSTPGTELPSSPSEGEGDREGDRAPRQPGRVMAFEEVELRYQLGEMQARLAAAEAELERLTAHPLRGPRAWLGRRLRRARRGGQ
jgi:O-methyltransferase